ncbi:MAG TPA: Gfo/Idh/MocA family oxidoreductase [Terriglobia bacterium]|nr:Gfo/Idh/MocA family oxidoreductase [Terriglobia bacterium]
MSNDSEVSRRDFLKTGAKTGAGLAALSGITFITHPERVFGANDRVRVAVCGIHGQGFVHVRQYSKMPDVEVAAVCDVDENVINQRLGQMDKMKIPKPKTYTDVRKLMEDKSVDVISIATPNHWHSLIGIWACQAGKDVYVEKPCSHNWWEGHQLVLAAQKYNRIMQHGTNSRSGDAIIEAVKKMRDGLIGEIYLSRGLCYKWRDTIGHAPEQPVPAGVHYDLWTGPAPLKPFTKNRFHYNWHWVWDTGNGDIGNQGIHEMDVARWGLGVGFPTKASAIGGHFMFDDDQTTPNTLNCAFEFDMPDGKRKMLEFEVRHWITNHEAEIGSGAFKSAGLPPAGLNGQAGKPAKSKSKGPRLGPSAGTHNTVGNIFYGSKGYLAMEGYDSYMSWLGDDWEPGPQKLHAGGNNWANFIACVRSRKKEDLNAPIEEGHKSATLVHLANVSYRLGRTLKFDPETQQVVGDDEANNLLRDGDRGYRAPYVVPEEV